MTENIKMLLGYKAWADDFSFALACELPDAEVTKVRKSYFKTIGSVLNHIYVIDCVFKAHLQGEPHGYTARNTPEHPPLKALWESVKAINQWYLDYVTAVSDEALDEVVEFEFIGGGDGAMTRGEMLLHLANHGTYHHGMVSNMLHEVPVKVWANDLPVYLRELRNSH